MIHEYLNKEGLSYFNDTVNDRVRNRIKYKGDFSLKNNQTDWNELAPTEVGHAYQLVEDEVDKIKIDNVKYSAGDWIVVMNKTILDEDGKVVDEDGNETNVDVRKLGSQVDDIIDYGYYTKLDLDRDGGYYAVAEYDELNYPYALEHFDDVVASTGGCSVFRSGSRVGRNLDWIYNDQLDFIVRVPAKPGRYASIGVCGQIDKLTRDFAEHNEYASEYVLLPFYCVDGINEKGLFVSMNVMPNNNTPDKIEPQGTNAKRLVSICANMIPRYILDHCATVDEAIYTIESRMEIHFSKKARESGFLPHFMIGDATKTYLVEFDGVNIHFTYCSLDKPAIMTNFQVYGTVKNEDGTYNTPENKASGLPSVVNKLGPHSAGVERYNLALAGLKANMDPFDVLKSLTYVNTYKDSTNPFWYSEYVGLAGTTIDSDPSAFATPISVAKNAYENRSRDPENPNYGTWQTKHGSLYSITEKSLTYYTQWEMDTDEAQGRKFTFDDLIADPPIILGDELPSIAYARDDWFYGRKYTDADGQVQHDVYCVKYLENGNKTYAKVDWDLSDRIAKGVELDGTVVAGAIKVGNIAENYATESFAWAEGSETKATNRSAHAEGQLTTACGQFSHAEGLQTMASGYVTHAEGKETNALGEASHAEGQDTTANGDYSHAEGKSTNANKESAHAEGQGTVASGKISHAEGESTIASGERSHAEGDNTHATGKTSHAEGYSTYAEGDYSHSEGRGGFAKGYASHAEGYQTEANGIYSHAEGGSTKALEQYAHAEGQGTEAQAKYTHAEGFQSIASGEHSHAEGCKSTASGNSAHTEGNQTVAEGNSAHGEGFKSKAKGESSHAEGNETNAEGKYSHAEGDQTKALEESSHAEGKQTEAQGLCSHAEGYAAEASGQTSHAEGNQSVASGKYSHAEGDQTKANGESSHAEGYGAQAFGDYSHAEGQATSAERSHAHAEGYSTNASGVASHSEGVNSEASGDKSHAEGMSTKSIGEGSHAEGRENQAHGNYSHVEGYGSTTTTAGEGAHAEGYDTHAENKGAHAEGYSTHATGMYSHAEGSSTNASEISSHAEGASTVASGEDAHAEGHRTLASGYATHAEGFNTEAKVSTAHAEGWNTHAEGAGSHTEGFQTVASGNYSHAEGYSAKTSADAEASHAEGYNTITGKSYQHVQGKYNDPTNSVSDKNYVDIIGWGSTTEQEGQIEYDYNDIEATDELGNKYLAGDVYVECDNLADGKKLEPLPSYGEDEVNYKLGVKYNEEDDKYELEWQEHNPIKIVEELPEDLEAGTLYVIDGEKVESYIYDEENDKTIQLNDIDIVDFVEELPATGEEDRLYVIKDNDDTKTYVYNKLENTFVEISSTKKDDEKEQIVLEFGKEVPQTLDRQKIFVKLDKNGYWAIEPSDEAKVVYNPGTQYMYISEQYPKGYFKWDNETKLIHLVIPEDNFDRAFAPPTLVDSIYTDGDAYNNIFQDYCSMTMNPEYTTKNRMLRKFKSNQHVEFYCMEDHIDDISDVYYFKWVNGKPSAVSWDVNAQSFTVQEGATYNCFFNNSGLEITTMRWGLLRYIRRTDWSQPHIEMTNVMTPESFMSINSYYIGDSRFPYQPYAGGLRCFHYEDVVNFEVKGSAYVYDEMNGKIIPINCDCQGGGEEKEERKILKFSEELPTSDVVGHQRIYVHIENSGYWVIQQSEAGRIDYAPYPKILYINSLYPQGRFEWDEETKLIHLIIPEENFDRAFAPTMLTVKCVTEDDAYYSVFKRYCNISTDFTRATKERRLLAYERSDFPGIEAIYCMEDHINDMADVYYFNWEGTPDPGVVIDPNTQTVKYTNSTPTMEDDFSQEGIDQSHVVRNQLIGYMRRLHWENYRIYGTSVMTPNSFISVNTYYKGDDRLPYSQYAGGLRCFRYQDVQDVDVSGKAYVYDELDGKVIPIGGGGGDIDVDSLESNTLITTNKKLVLAINEIKNEIGDVENVLYNMTRGGGV